MNALLGVDYVFHLAWSGTPGSSNHDPIAHALTNLTPTLALFDACARSKVKRVIYLSSGGAVYGRAMMLPIPEYHPTSPISAYGITKLAAESYLDFYGREHRMEYVILRPSVPYGERQNLKRGQGAVGVFLNCALTGEPITLWGGSEIARDFFYVGDLSGACIAALDPNVERGIYNIGGGDALTLGRLIEQIEGITKVRLKVRTEAPRDCDPASIVLDISKARRRLNWNPSVDLAEGLRRTWNWLQEARFAESQTSSMALK
jgi:UDP-glucose 4-epimerase